MSQLKIPETRGRPKKQQTRTLDPKYKQIFSDNSAIIHACSLIYVFEVFIDTKKEKRVGHKDGGFTIYDKTDQLYCFENLEEILVGWGFQALLENQNLHDLIKLLPAIGPKIILREFIQLIDTIIKMHQTDKQQLIIAQILSDPSKSSEMDAIYPYMRFTSKALQSLKIQSPDKHKLIHDRVQTLWKPLLIIITHTILNCLTGNITNKYFKPFFSDAQNVYNTYIGQLNLEQIVSIVAENEEKRKGRREGEERYEGFRKFKQLETNNKIQIIPIVEYRKQRTQISPHKPTTQIIRPIISVPNARRAQPPPTTSQQPLKIQYKSPLILINSNQQNKVKQQIQMNSQSKQQSNKNIDGNQSQQKNGVKSKMQQQEFSQEILP